jgi:putative salt-induced outer membrane protein YdiY
MKNALLMSALLTALGSSSAVFAQEENKQKDFTLDGELGLILTTGNTESASLKGRLSAKHEMVSWSNEYLVEGFFRQDEVENDVGEKETQTQEQSYLLSAQGNYKLENPENRLFVFGSYQDDRFSGFDFQSTLAAGWSSVLYDTPTHKLTYSIGPGYSFADRTNGEDASSFIVRGAVDYDWKISETAAFKQRFSTEAGSENTKSRSESSISAKIAEALSMKFSIVLDHNTNVAAGVEKLDTETSVTLVYNFF